jgi:hypothetical protein
VEQRLRLQILLSRKAGQNVPRDRFSHCEEEQQSKAGIQHFVPMRSTLITRCMCLGISTAVSNILWNISVVIAKAVRCWLLTMKPLVDFFVAVYGVCDRQIDTGIAFPFEFVHCQLQIIVLLMPLTDLFIFQFVS